MSTGNEDDDLEEFGLEFKERTPATKEANEIFRDVPQYVAVPGDIDSLSAVRVAELPSAFSGAVFGKGIQWGKASPSIKLKLGKEIDFKPGMIFGPPILGKALDADGNSPAPPVLPTKSAGYHDLVQFPEDVNEPMELAPPIRIKTEVKFVSTGTFFASLFNKPIS